MAKDRTFAVFLGKDTQKSAAGFVVENDFFAVLETETENANNDLRLATEALSEILKTEVIVSANELKQIIEPFFQKHKLKSIALGYFHKEQLFTYVIQATVFLLRQKQLYLASQEKEPLSGQIKKNDHFLFCSKTTAKLVSQKPVLVFQEQEPKLLIEEFKKQHSPEKGALLVVQTQYEPTPTMVFETLPSQESSSLVPNQHKINLPNLKNRLPVLLNSKWLKLAGLILILSLVLWQVIILLNRSLTNRREQVFKQKLAVLSQDFTELEKELQKNPTKAVTQIKTLNEELSLLLADYKIQSSQANQLKQKINNLTKTYGNAQVTKEGLFFDLSLIDNKAEASFLDVTTNSLVLLDSKNKRLYSVNIENKKVREVLFAKNSQPVLATEYDETFYAYDPKTGIYKENNNQLENIVKADKALGQIIDLDVFNSNIYLLSQDKDEIFKFTPVEGGYSSKLSYFQAGQSLNLAEAKNMSIDFSIYLLTSKIYQFTGGAKEQFNNPEQLDDQTLAKIYKNSDTSFIYLLDKKNSRVIALNKEGKIIKSIFNPLLSDCDYFGVYQDELIIFLRQNKLYKLDNF